MVELPFRFADQDLSRRLELCSAWRGVRYAEAYVRLHPQADSAVQPVAGGYAIFIDSGSPVNGARALGLNGPVSMDQVLEFENFYLSRGVKPVLMLSPFADSSLRSLLAGRGYAVRQFFNVLARFISPDFNPRPVNDDMEVVLAGPDEADLWLQTVAEGFDGTATPSLATFDILGPNFHAADAQPYLAWVRNPSGERQPAGGGGMYVCPQERVVELGGASTRVSYRRRGVQTALIEARLAAARQAGCDLAMVMTVPGSDSQRNLSRTGFWLAYTKVVLEKVDSA